MTALGAEAVMRAGDTSVLGDVHNAKEGLFIWQICAVLEEGMDGTVTEL